MSVGNATKGFATYGYFQPCFSLNKDDNIHRSSAKNALKSLKSKLPPIPSIFTPRTIRNGFLIKL